MTLDELELRGDKDELIPKSNIKVKLQAKPMLPSTTPPIPYSTTPTQGTAEQDQQPKRKIVRFLDLSNLVVAHKLNVGLPVELRT